MENTMLKLNQNYSLNISNTIIWHDNTSFLNIYLSEEKGIGVGISR